MMASSQDSNKGMPGHCPTPPNSVASMYAAPHGRHMPQGGSGSPGPSSAFFPAGCSTGNFSNAQFGNDQQPARTPPAHPSFMRPMGDDGQNAGFGFDTKYLEDYLKVIESFQGGTGDSRNYYDSRNIYETNRSLQSLADTFNYMYASSMSSLRSSANNSYASSNQTDTYTNSRARSAGLPPMQQAMAQSLRHSDMHSSQNDLRHTTDMQMAPNHNDFGGVEPKMEMPEPPDTPNTVHALPPMSSSSCRLDMNHTANNLTHRSNYLESNNHLKMDNPTNGTCDSPPNVIPHVAKPPVMQQSTPSSAGSPCAPVDVSIHHLSNDGPQMKVNAVNDIDINKDEKNGDQSENDSELEDGDLSDDEDQENMSEVSDPDDAADSEASSDNDDDLDDDEEDDDAENDVKNEPNDDDDFEYDDADTEIDEPKGSDDELLTQIKEEILDEPDEEDPIPTKRRRGRKTKPTKRILPSSDRKRGRSRDGDSTRRRGRKPKGTKVCEKCSRKFERNDTYQRHLLQHDTIKMFECNICGCKYERQEHLTRHHRSHTGVTYRCGYCDVSFKQQRPYRDHMLTLHGQKKPFICTYPGCLFRAATPSQVEKHAEIHGPEKHYKCEKCNRDFAQVNGLRSHQRSCYEKRQYLCDYCGAKFNFLGSLKSHRYIHTGEKPYACSDCDARFTDHRNLRRHRLIHENAYPYPCEYCDKKFRHSNSLKAHLKMHQNCSQWDRPPEVHPSAHPGPMPAMEYLLANVMNQASLNQAAMNSATC